jgi:CRISP-associated protein Cas1
MGGWFYGITIGLNEKNVFLRRSQFRLAEQEYFARTLARQLVAGKIRNQRTLLQRNHVEPNRNTLAGARAAHGILRHHATMSSQIAIRLLG